MAANPGLEAVIDSDPDDEHSYFVYGLGQGALVERSQPTHQVLFWIGVKDDEIGDTVWTANPFVT